MEVRSQKTKEAFIKYLEEHPEERFWQAVRNFSGYGFILARNYSDAENDVSTIDTFYWEENGNSN